MARRSVRLRTFRPLPARVGERALPPVQLREGDQLVWEGVSEQRLKESQRILRFGGLSLHGLADKNGLVWPVLSVLGKPYIYRGLWAQWFSQTKLLLPYAYPCDAL